MRGLEVPMLTLSQSCAWTMISRIVVEPCQDAWLTMHDGEGLTTERWYGAERKSCDGTCLGEAVRRTTSTIKYSHHARAGRGA